MRGPDLVIAVPTRAAVASLSFAYLAKCICRTANEWGDTVAVMAIPDCHIIQARNMIVQRVLELEANWVLWLDDDAGPPDDVAMRLREHDKDITCPLFRRQRGSDMTIHHVSEDETKMKQVDPSRKTLIQVDSIGMHTVLMKVEALRRIVEERNPPFHTNAVDGTGSDIQFCRVARKAGVEIFCDRSLYSYHIWEDIH